MIQQVKLCFKFPILLLLIFTTNQVGAAESPIYGIKKTFVQTVDISQRSSIDVSTGSIIDAVDGFGGTGGGAGIFYTRDISKIDVYAVPWSDGTIAMDVYYKNGTIKKLGVSEVGIKSTFVIPDGEQLNQMQISASCITCYISSVKFSTRAVVTPSRSKIYGIKNSFIRTVDVSRKPQVSVRVGSIIDAVDGFGGPGGGADIFYTNDISKIDVYEVPWSGGTIAMQVYYKDGTTKKIGVSELGIKSTFVVPKGEELHQIKISADCETCYISSIQFLNRTVITELTSKIYGQEKHEEGLIYWDLEAESGTVPFIKHSDVVNAIGEYNFDNDNSLTILGHGGDRDAGDDDHFLLDGIKTIHVYSGEYEYIKLLTGSDHARAHSANALALKFNYIDGTSREFGNAASLSNSKEEVFDLQGRYLTQILLSYPCSDLRSIAGDWQSDLGCYPSSIQFVTTNATDSYGGFTTGDDPEQILYVNNKGLTFNSGWIIDGLHVSGESANHIGGLGGGQTTISTDGLYYIDLFLKEWAGAWRVAALEFNYKDNKPKISLGNRTNIVDWYDNNLTYEGNRRRIYFEGSTILKAIRAGSTGGYLAYLQFITGEKPPSQFSGLTAYRNVGWEAQSTQPFYYTVLDKTKNDFSTSAHKRVIGLLSTSDGVLINASHVAEDDLDADALTLMTCEPAGEFGAKPGYLNAEQEYGAWAIAQKAHPCVLARNKELEWYSLPSIIDSSSNSRRLVGHRGTYESQGLDAQFQCLSGDQSECLEYNHSDTLRHTPHTNNRSSDYSWAKGQFTGLSSSLQSISSDIEIFVSASNQRVLVLPIRQSNRHGAIVQVGADQALNVYTDLSYTSNLDYSNNSDHYIGTIPTGTHRFIWDQNVNEGEWRYLDQTVNIMEYGELVQRATLLKKDTYCAQISPSHEKLYCRTNSHGQKHTIARHIHQVALHDAQYSDAQNYDAEFQNEHTQAMALLRERLVDFQQSKDKIQSLISHLVESKKSHNSFFSNLWSGVKTVLNVAKNLIIGEISGLVADAKRNYNDAYNFFSHPSLQNLEAVVVDASPLAHDVLSAIQEGEVIVEEAEGAAKMIEHFSALIKKDGFEEGLREIGIETWRHYHNDSIRALRDAGIGIDQLADADLIWSGYSSVSAFISQTQESTIDNDKITYRSISSGVGNDSLTQQWLHNIRALQSNNWAVNQTSDFETKQLRNAFLSYVMGADYGSSLNGATSAEAGGTLAQTAQNASHPIHTDDTHITLTNMLVRLLDDRQGNNHQPSFKPEIRWVSSDKLGGVSAGFLSDGDDGVILFNKAQRDMHSAKEFNKLYLEEFGHWLNFQRCKLSERTMSHCYGAQGDVGARLVAALSLPDSSFVNATDFRIASQDLPQYLNVAHQVVDLYQQEDGFRTRARLDTFPGLSSFNNKGSHLASSILFRVGFNIPSLLTLENASLKDSLEITLDIVLDTKSGYVSNPQKTCKKNETYENERCEQILWATFYIRDQLKAQVGFSAAQKEKWGGAEGLDPKASIRLIRRHGVKVPLQTYRQFTSDNLDEDEKLKDHAGKYIKSVTLEGKVGVKGLKYQKGKFTRTHGNLSAGLKGSLIAEYFDTSQYGAIIAADVVTATVGYIAGCMAAIGLGGEAIVEGCEAGSIALETAGMFVEANVTDSEVWLAGSASIGIPLAEVAQTIISSGSTEPIAEGAADVPSSLRNKVSNLWGESPFVFLVEPGISYGISKPTIIKKRETNGLSASDVGAIEVFD